MDNTINHQKKIAAHQRNNRIIISISILVFFLAGIFLFFPAKKVLSISGRKYPEIEFFSQTAITNGFCISYTHSVNKGRVHDYYDCTNKNSLTLNRTVFVSYGAGIPEPEETEGAEFTVLPNGYQISNLQRHVPQLTMAVGLIANHTIAIGNNVQNSVEYPFTAFFEPQTSIILKIQKISLLKYILYKNKFIENLK